jgi:hypothetical protein
MDCVFVSVTEISFLFRQEKDKFGTNFNYTQAYERFC